MLEKVEKKEIMTVWDAKVKYETKQFIMVITEEVDRGQKDLGYVMYTADTGREIAKVPTSELKGLRFGIFQGNDSWPYPSYGGLEVVHHN